MPNWCENELKITGKREEIDKFIMEAKGYGIKWGEKELTPTEQLIEKLTNDKKIHEINFYNFVSPTKKEMENPYNDFGYEWQCKHWGTKWQSDTFYIHRTPRTVTYTFETAWSPPIPVIVAMIEKYPNLKFKLRYWEGGSGFQGILQGESGEVTIENTYDYHGRKGG